MEIQFREDVRKMWVGWYGYQGFLGLDMIGRGGEKWRLLAEL